MTTEKNISLIEAELAFIGRAVSGMDTRDYEAQHDIHLALESARRALFELRLDMQADTSEEIPAGVSEPDADPVPVAA